MAEATVYGSTALWTRLSHSVARSQSPRPVEVDLMGGVVRDLLAAPPVLREASSAPCARTLSSHRPSCGSALQSPA